MLQPLPCIVCLRPSIDLFQIYGRLEREGARRPYSPS